MEFRLQPFTIEDFSKLPKTTDTQNGGESPKITKEPTDSSGSDDSDLDDDPAKPTPATVSWKPIKKFHGYDGKLKL